MERQVMSLVKEAEPAKESERRLTEREREGEQRLFSLGSHQRSV